MGTTEQAEDLSVDNGRQVDVILSREELRTLRTEGEVHLTLENGVGVNLYTGA